MRNVHVLVVEDEFLIRMTLAEALADEGFQVTEATSGPEALSRVGEVGRIDLLLTDMSLPGGMNGAAVARAARERFPDLSVIYVTGSPDSVTVADRTERDLCIAKPYLPSEICAAARRMVTLSPRPSLVDAGRQRQANQLG